ncbi:MAG: sortase [Chloroflexi bacterium]|nr:sortase [Chloroflexota bacterium]MCC6892100.1 sortase [Anaerolineae bacterium]
MRDKRPVDELSIEELEKILAIRKREEREKRLDRMKRAGRVVLPEPTTPAAPSAPIPQIPGVTVPAAPMTTAPAPVYAPEPVRPMQPATPEFEDDNHTARAAERSRFWKSFVNQSMLLVEALAVVGLLFLGYQLISAQTKLQEETASAQALAEQQRVASLPTLVPTPQIQLSAVVLPGGHILRDNGEVLFNIDEIPASLRGMVADQIYVPISARPQATSETAVQINIPQINVNHTIVPGTDWEAMKLGVGMLMNGVNPGDASGNLVLSGHNDIYGEVFRDLDKLVAGDQFTVRTQTQEFVYAVTETKIVDPTEVSVMDARGGATITLISCYPYKVNNKRIVIFGQRVGPSGGAA